MMRKNLIRATCLLSFLLLGALYSASITVKQAEALPIKEYQTEYLFLNTTVWNQIAAANQTWQIAHALIGLSGLTQWKGHMLQLESQLSGIDTLYKALPYNMFTMDILLRKYDFALQYAISATNDSNVFQYNVYTVVASLCNPPTQLCLQYMQISSSLASQTDSIEKEVLAIGSLFMKAKLEMLELPRLICNPLQVTVAGHIYCTGQSVNGTATLTLINTVTKQTISLGTAQADSFFDVFFDITLPNTVGAGHYQMIMSDSGGAQASSFFDVFVTLPTPFEPATIIPITVLIAAIATLAVASRRVRRPI